MTKPRHRQLLRREATQGSAKKPNSNPLSIYSRFYVLLRASTPAWSCTHPFCPVDTEAQGIEIPRLDITQPTVTAKTRPLVSCPRSVPPHLARSCRGPPGSQLPAAPQLRLAAGPRGHPGPAAGRRFNQKWSKVDLGVLDRDPQPSRVTLTRPHTDAPSLAPEFALRVKRPPQRQCCTDAHGA